MIKFIRQNTLYLILIFLSLISACGAVVYRLYRLNTPGIIFSLILAIIISWLFLRSLTKDINNPRHWKLPSKQQTKSVSSALIWLYVSYILFYIAAFYVLWSSRTGQALISPWEVIPNYFFFIYATLTLILLTLLSTSRVKLSLFFISLHYFLTLIVAVIVYKIGYGFDPFIHQATENLIAKTGAVMPKPFYYLGQYSLVVILHKITTTSLVWFDKLLVPTLAAIFLPSALWQFLNKWFSNKKNTLLLMVAILILPATIFIITTPQNLAYLFLILTILYGLTCVNSPQLAVAYLLAITSLLIHPIAGIPAVLFIMALHIYYSDKLKLKKYFYSLIFILTSTILPIIFYFLAKQPGVAAQATTSFPWPEFIIPGKENFILNFIYLYGFNLKIIISLLGLAGIIIAYRHRQTCKILFISLGGALAMIIAYFLTNKLTFNFLIDYERNNYADRLLLLAIIFLIPFIFTTLYGLIEKITKENKSIKIIFSIFLIILITTSLYLAYPRFDRYYNSHGLSTNKTDIETVNWIEQDANADYIVLASQQVSAAALHEFGFKKYYKNDIFFYPIPTSSLLYQYYLDMVYKKPTKKTITAAMNLAEVNQAYFVLNKYWWAFDKILAEAKLEADSWIKIDQGEIYIFKYEK